MSPRLLPERSRQRRSAFERARRARQSAGTRTIRVLIMAAGVIIPRKSHGGVDMKFRPLHDRVVLRRIEQETKTLGGIIIPDTAKEKPQEGEVVAVGPGTRDENGKLHALDVKAGDRVLFGKWSGTEVKIDGEELLIMKESDVMGVIEGAKAGKTKAA